MNTLHTAWVLLMLLYLVTALYVEVVTDVYLPRRVSGLFLTIGIAIFLSLNMDLFVIRGISAIWVEAIILSFLTATWICAIAITLAYIEIYKSHPETENGSV